MSRPITKHSVLLNNDDSTVNYNDDFSKYWNGDVLYHLSRLKAAFLVRKHHIKAINDTLIAIALLQTELVDTRLELNEATVTADLARTNRQRYQDKNKELEAVNKQLNSTIENYEKRLDIAEKELDTIKSEKAALESKAKLLDKILNTIEESGEIQ